MKWSIEEDRILKRLKAGGRSNRFIALFLLRSRSAVIGRWDRLTGGPKRRGDHKPKVTVVRGHHDDNHYIEKWADRKARLQACR